MAVSSLREILFYSLNEFRQIDSANAQNIEDCLKHLPQGIDNDELLAWWKLQSVAWIASLISYISWMLSDKRIDHDYFLAIHNTVNPTTSSSWSMPVEITTGLDRPIIKGGFLDRDFSIFEYHFSRSEQGLLVKSQEYPSKNNTSDSLQLVLDFLSFLLDKYHYGYLGFRASQARRWDYAETTLAAGMFGPEIRQDMFDLDFSQIESVIEYLVSLDSPVDKLSLIELLRVRHRAVLDSSLESKLITLWSAMEAQWAEEKSGDQLFSIEEKEQINASLNFLPKKKLEKLLDQASKLKSKTRNDRIIEEVEKMECVKGWDVGKTVRAIHGLRSKFAHGGMVDESETENVYRYISFLMQIFDELISNSISQIGVEFSPPNSK